MKESTNTSKIDLSAIAERALTLSPLMTGREKFETEEIVNTKLTISKFDFAQLDNATYPVIVFAEYPDKYYCGGFILNKMLTDIAEEYEDIDSFRDESGIYTLDDLFEPLRIKLVPDKTRDGKRNITKVEIV